VYRVFNKSSGLVEVSSDVVFDETNGSPREQVYLDDVDEDDVPTAAIRTMAIGECWRLVLKGLELRTRQHKMLNVNVLRL
jgi:hypothetical protein